MLCHAILALRMVLRDVRYWHSVWCYAICDVRIRRGREEGEEEEREEEKEGGGGGGGSRRECRE
eukprot:2192892-Rhodomonas_salina.2